MEHVLSSLTRSLPLPILSLTLKYSTSWHSTEGLHCCFTEGSVIKKDKYFLDGAIKMGIEKINQERWPLFY